MRSSELKRQSARHMEHLHLSYPAPLRCDIVDGTRPEAIKLAPVVKALRQGKDEFKVQVVTSGQHGEIRRSALAAFGPRTGQCIGHRTDQRVVGGLCAASCKRSGVATRSCCRTIRPIVAWQPQSIHTATDWRANGS